MGRAIVDVAWPLLLQMIPLPEGTRLLSAGMNERGDLRLDLAHESLPEGIQQREPQFTRDAAGTVTFDGWGRVWE